MKDIEITYADDQDFAAIVEMVKANEILGMPEEVISRSYYSPASVKQRVDIGMETIFVAKTEGTLVGLITLATGVSDDICAIPIVLVPSEYRKKGIGSLLVKKAIEEVTKTGIKKIYANVHYKNIPSLVMFSKLGFIPEMYMRDMYKMGENVVIYAYYTE
jgi:L-amino acid N-acyltransferase YncA